MENESIPTKTYRMSMKSFYSGITAKYLTWTKFQLVFPFSNFKKSTSKIWATRLSWNELQMESRVGGWRVRPEERKRERGREGKRERRRDREKERESA